MKNEVARKNSTFKLADICTLLEEANGAVTADNWQKCLSLVKAEGEKFWKLDPHRDTVIEPVIVNLGSDTSSDTNDSFDSSSASDGESPRLRPQLTDIQNMYIYVLFICFSCFI